MAFLCPARIKKEWKKRVQANSRPRGQQAAPGRITGSASMDTLVRVAFEKNNGGRKMIMMVLHDFTPCTDDELGVKRGDRVRVLYRELEWAYAIRDDGAEGFMPFSYLASPVKLSRRAVPEEGATGECRRSSRPQENISQITNKMSSLMLASTRAVQFSRNTSSSSTEDLSQSIRSSSSTDSDSSEIQFKPPVENIARLGALVQSTAKLSVQRRKQKQVERDDSDTPSISSGVHSDTESPASSIDRPASRRPRELLYNTACDSDSGCEQNSPKQTRARHDKTTESSQETSFETFDKSPLGVYLVMFSFDANAEDDMSVRPGEFVTVLNKDDPDWYWVKTRDDDEGFVPSGYLCDVNGPELPPDQDSYNADESAMTDNTLFPEPGHLVTSTPLRPTTNGRCMPQKMMILHDYEARQTDDISVKQGQYVYVDMDNQRFLDWIWVYSQVTQHEGFIPREFAKLNNNRS